MIPGRQLLNRVLKPGLVGGYVLTSALLNIPQHFIF